MSNVNQDIRFSNYKNNINNPHSLYDFIKPMRWIFNTVDPLSTSGENEWFYLNTVSGDLFQKTNGQWFQVYNFDTAIATGITNTETDGSGAPVTNGVIGNTAHFKSLVTTADIDLTTNINDLEFAMNDFYKPKTLNLVTNTKQEYGNASPPNVNDDSSKGYIIGSLYSQISGGVAQLYIAQSVSVGAAVWLPVSGTTPTIEPKDYVNWGSSVPHTQAIIGGWQDINFGVNILTYAQKTPSSLFTTYFDGSRQVFVRQPSAPTAFHISISMNVEDFSGSTIQEQYYLVRMIRKIGLFVSPQSLSEFVLPVSSVANRKQFYNMYFVESQPLNNTTVEYYFQIWGRKTGGGVADNFNINNWGVSFSEI